MTILKILVILELKNIITFLLFDYFITTRLFYQIPFGPKLHEKSFNNHFIWARQNSMKNPTRTIFLQKESGWGKWPVSVIYFF